MHRISSLEQASIKALETFSIIAAALTPSAMALLPYPLGLGGHRRPLTKDPPGIRPHFVDAEPLPGHSEEPASVQAASRNFFLLVSNMAFAQARYRRDKAVTTIQIWRLFYASLHFAMSRLHSAASLLQCHLS